MLFLGGVLEEKRFLVQEFAVYLENLAHRKTPVEGVRNINISFILQIEKMYLKEYGNYRGLSLFLVPGTVVIDKIRSKNRNSLISPSRITNITEELPNVRNRIHFPRAFSPHLSEFCGYTDDLVGTR